MKSKNKGILYELVVAEKLKDRGYTNVKITKASHEYGADILAFKNGLESLFQCKNYKGKVGVKAVQEVSTAMEIYDADEGFVVCDTAYTKPAYTAIGKIDDKPIQLLTLDEIKAWPRNKIEPESFTPWPYQQETLNKLAQHRKNGNKAALVVMATGLGKTLVSAWDLNNQLKEGAKTLFLVHRKDILVENAAKFNAIVNDESQRFKLGIFFRGKKFENQDIIFSTFQTIRKHFKTTPKNYFDFIIVDEAHHSPAKTYAEVLNYFQPKFCLGITATPQRLIEKDNEFILNKFGPPIENLNLEEALCRGYLSPIKYSVYCDNVDYQKLKATKKKLSIEQLNKSYFIPTKDEDIERIIEQEKSKIKNPKAIIFCPSIKYITAVKAIGLFADADVYHSNLSDFDRELIFRKFKTGKVTTLLVVDLFNEGIDIPDANLIVFLRTTYSPTIFFQQLGRGLRKLDIKVKPYLRVLDFVGVIKTLKETINIFSHLILIKNFCENVENIKSNPRIPSSGVKSFPKGLEPLELNFFQPTSKVVHKETIVEEKSFLEEIELLRSHLRKSDGWTENEIMEQLLPIAKDLEHFPSSKELLALNKADLSVAVSRNGGYPYFAEKMGYPLKEKPKGYWKKAENVKVELNRIYLSKQYIPSGRKLEELGFSSLSNAIKDLGEYGEVVRGFGFPYEKKQTELGTWNDIEKLKGELTNIFGKKGILPQTEFLRIKGRHDLIKAIQDQFKTFFKASQSLGLAYGGRKPPKYWDDLENIKNELKPYCKGEHSDVFPSSEDLKQEDRKDLNSVITKKFKSRSDAAMKLGFRWEGRLPEGYWDEFSTLENAINQFIENCPDCEGMPTQDILSKNGRNDLLGGINKHGGISKVKEKLKLPTNKREKG